MKYLFLDVETTGLDNEKCAIHQLSGCIVVNNKVEEVFDFKIKPFQGAIIDDSALEINNLKSSDLYGDSYIDEKIVYQKFTNLLSKFVNKFDKKDKFYLVGFNVHFDKQFLYNMFIRNGDNYLFSFIWGNHIDVMVLATQHLLYDRVNMKDFKQSTVAEYLGFKVDENQLHNSLYDIFLCLGIYCHITKEKFEQKDNLGIQVNLDAQLIVLESSEFNYSELNETFYNGKYKGKTVRYVLENDPNYICWFYNNLTSQTKVSRKVYEEAQKLMNDQHQKNYEQNRRNANRQTKTNISEERSWQEEDKLKEEFRQKQIYDDIVDKHAKAWD